MELVVYQYSSIIFKFSHLEANFQENKTIVLNRDQRKLRRLFFHMLVFDIIECLSETHNDLLLQSVLNNMFWID